MTSEATGYYDSADGLRLFYRDYGEDRPGTPVLCLPGLTRNSRDFEDLALHLSARRRVVAPDLRGRGFSQHDPDWRNYHPGTYVADTLRLLDHLGMKRAIVIGTSLGGLIAMAMALVQKERLAGVVLNDIGPEVAPEGLTRIRTYTGRLPPVSSWEEAATQAREIYGRWWPGLGDDAWGRLARRAYRERDGLPELDMDPAIGRAVRELAPPTGDPWLVFDALRGLPVLVLRGEMSDILSADTLGRMQAQNPDLSAVTVPGRGHAPLLDEPESLDVIDQFLGDIP
jgi:pimeloyl-ACP methyl ester carboxylesterase